jgi:hypothetical protein
MAVNIKSKEIQVQKPAQSLQAFQQKLATGEDLQTGILKPLLIGFGSLVVLSVGFFGIRAWRISVVEKHEAAVAELVQEVQGDGITPVAPAEVEKRMREKLPSLEALVKSAPSPKRAATEALVASWKLAIDGKGGFKAHAENPWDSLRQAQYAISMGQAKEAFAVLAPLRASANPSEPWGSLYWSTLIDADRLQGNREQALKDLADFKARFKEQGNAAPLEQMVQGI